MVLIPAICLREDCSMSPILLNIYPQKVVPPTEEQRRRMNEATGVVWKWLPGGTFTGESAWKKECSEARKVSITRILYLGTTTLWLRSRKGELEECVRVTRELMGEWEEQENEDMDESVEFGR